MKKQADIFPSFFIILFFIIAGFASSRADSGAIEKILSSSPILPGKELRALWVTRLELTSREEIDRLLDIALRARFHVLFAQVRGRGDALYRSTLEPPAPELSRPIDEFDPLEYLLERAHVRGIQVHAWVNVYYVWSDGGAKPPAGHVVRKHPEWLLTDTNGTRMDELGVDAWKSRGAEGYFISPASKEAREYTIKVIKEIASSYNIDGIHLDYTRYPGMAFGYSEDERTRFSLRYGVDPLELVTSREQVEDIVGSRGTESLDSLLVEWRAEQVDSMVSGVRSALDTLVLSAAVISDPGEARRTKGQDWIKWVQRDMVDFVVLMAYNDSPDTIRDRARYLKNVIGIDRFLVGFGLFGGRARYLKPAVSLLRREGVMGYSLFSYKQMADYPFSVKYVNSVLLGTGDNTSD